MYFQLPPFQCLVFISLLSGTLGIYESTPHAIENVVVYSSMRFIMFDAKCFAGLKKRSHAMLRFWVEKLRAVISFIKMIRVQDGHFAVIAKGGREPQRFLIKLRYLHNPEFLKLLKQAEEEFGFSEEGAIGIPCQPDELQKILTM